MRETPYEAGGFAFSDEQMMEKAVKEGEGIRYIKNSADMKNPQVVFQVYCQMAGQRLFETPVGYVYLHELQEYLKAEESILNEDIPPIPVISDLESLKMEEGSSGQKGSRERTKEKTVREAKERNKDYKPLFRASLSVSVILLLIIIGMFAVAATSGNINIINYENALIEKYEIWETQLKEREEKLKEREKAFNQKDVPAGETDL